VKAQWPGGAGENESYSEMKISAAAAAIS